MDVPKADCSVEGCDRPNEARGLCEPHYKRLMRDGSVGPLDRLNHRQDGPCTVEGCGRLKVAKELCRGHYQRLISTGDLGGPTIPNRTPRGLYSGCLVDGCDRPHAGKGYCNGHLRRLRVAGIPGPAFGLHRVTACSVQGCGRVAHAHGMCRQHYDAKRR